MNNKHKKIIKNKVKYMKKEMNKYREKNKK